MRNKVNSLIEIAVLYVFGGIAYVCTELVYRGHSHSSMFVLGGICFLLIGTLNEKYPWDMPLWKQQAISAVMITVFEFFCGLIVNVWLKIGVWDYSNMPFNLMGQICLPFTIIWFFLAIPVIILDDVIRWKLFGEEKPRYKLW